jgi:ketosteroid isomerase-like protein
MDADVQMLIYELERGRDAWIHGHTERFESSVLVQADDMTIFGPFGGDIIRATPDIEERQHRVSSQFYGGTGANEVVSVIRSGDLVVIVQVERSEAMFEGRSTPQPWTLRTTQVFRRKGEGWARLHRHADPLIDGRSFDDTLGIARGDRPPGA